MFLYSNNHIKLSVDIVNRMCFKYVNAKIYLDILIYSLISLRIIILIKIVLSHMN